MTRGQSARVFLFKLNVQVNIKYFWQTKICNGLNLYFKNTFQRLNVRRPTLIQQENLFTRFIKQTLTKNSFSTSPSSYQDLLQRVKGSEKAKGRSNLNFEQWLVGFTDGDGTFHFSKSKDGKWILHFKIGQSSYNLRVLYYIKTQLGVGSVHVESKTTNADFRIRNRDHIGSIIIPIFNKNPLLTSKYFNFLKFRKAYDILVNQNLSKIEKDNLLTELKNSEIPLDYVSPAWSVVNNKVNNIEEANQVVSKSWLVGFTEAEGSFYLVKKDANRLTHAFEITQKLDLIVLVSISQILGLKVSTKKNYNTVVTTNSRAISNIIEYYSKTMKGMKSLEFRIWQRSYVKHKGNFVELTKVRNKMRSIRSIRLNIDMSIKNRSY